MFKIVAVGLPGRLAGAAIPDTFEVVQALSRAVRQRVLSWYAFGQLACIWGKGKGLLESSSGDDNGSQVQVVEGRQKVVLVKWK